MEKSDLYRLNKDALVMLVEKIQDKLKKEMEMRDEIITSAEVEYTRCAYPDCFSFSVKYKWGNHVILKCDLCSIAFCQSHNFDRIFSGKCLTCQYSS